MENDILMRKIHYQIQTNLSQLKGLSKIWGKLYQTFYCS